ncbi:MAG: flippase [Aeriscardovia sp.]|nr:flippase [Aeriscardovia sp.]
MNLHNAINHIIKSKNIKNSGWIIGQQVFQMFLQLVVGVLTARYLGPSNYGSLNYTASFVTFVTAIATLGMDAVIIKALIDHPESEGEYLGTAMVFRVVSSFASSISIALIVFVLNLDDQLKVVLVILQSIQLYFKAIQIFDSWFKRYLKSKYVSIGKIVASIAVSAYKIWLLATAKSIVWFAASNSIVDGIIAIIEFYFYKKENGQKLKFRFSTGMKILKQSYHFIIAGLMVSFYSQMDRIMLGQFLTDADVGLYTTAATICGMWIFVPTAIIDSFQASIMETRKNGDYSKYIVRLEQLYGFIIWLCVGVSAVVSILASFIVTVLYGQDYLGSIETLRILIWSETFAMIGTARGIWILCENKNKYVKYYLCIGAVANLILNLILIPIYGNNGAAFATLLTQIITSLIAPLFFKETRIHTKIVIDSALVKWYFQRKNIN